MKPSLKPSMKPSNHPKRTTLVILAALACAAPAFAQSNPGKLDKITFATNWLAEAEHGGHYQALADGTYRKFGLDVTIRPGGPQINNRLLLAAGRVQFYMSANLIPSFTAVEQNIPIVSVASMFQKDPFVFMSHPGQGFDTWESLKNATAFVGSESMASIFQWLKKEHGFREERVKPYTFNPAPFLADRKSIQQGYVTAEPFAIEQQGKFKPNLFLAADHGFNTYSTLIETRRDTIEKSPDLVQRFVDASIIGWYNYLYGDNRAANALIKKSNPEMSDEQIAFSIAKMKEFGIVDSGDSLKLGIGAMTSARVQSFFAKMVSAGVVKSTIDPEKSYTLRFINKRVGIDLRPKTP